VVAVKQQIKKVYEVTCGDCICSSNIYGVRRRELLELELRKKGWKKTQEFGWQCPECVEKAKEL
jgi:hypothetical protein